MKKVAPLNFEVPAKSSYYKLDKRMLANEVHIRKNRKGEPCKKSVRRFALTAAILSAEVHSFTDKDKGMTCSRTYEGFSRDLSISPASVNRSLNSLKEKGIIERVGQSEYVSSLAKLKNSKEFNYIRLESWVLNITVKEKKKDEQGNTIISERPIRKSESLVFALIFTHCDNKKKKGTNKYPASYKEMADFLRLTQRAVRSAVAVLEFNGLIGRSMKGVSRKYKNVFYVNDNLLTQSREAKAETADSKQTKDKPSETKTETVSREVWYAQRKQEAEERAERNERKAQTDNRFKTADTELRTLASKEAYAELRGELSELALLQARRRELEERRIKALRRLHLTPDDLLPQYHCQICSDTGFTKQGRLCGCYAAAHNKGKLNK